MGCTLPHREVPAYSSLLKIPFRLNSLTVFTVFGHIMEKWWKEIRIARHCVLAIYCSSRAHSEQCLGCLRLLETGTGRRWGAGEGCLFRGPAYCLSLICGIGV